MILSDYYCASCDTEQERAVSSPAPDEVPCVFCDQRASWQPPRIKSMSVAASVSRGPVAKPDSPMYLDTRELGEGMPASEWREKRRKLYQERRHREFKRGD